jgi:hypothetical protein
LIAAWSRPFRSDGDILLQETGVGRALTALLEVYRVVTAPSMSTALARETIIRSYELGCALDQIVVPFLDRALAAGEYEWNTNVNA